MSSRSFIFSPCASQFEKTWVMHVSARFPDAVCTSPFIFEHRWMLLKLFFDGFSAKLQNGMREMHVGKEQLKHVRTPNIWSTSLLGARITGKNMWKEANRWCIACEFAYQSSKNNPVWWKNCFVMMGYFQQFSDTSASTIKTTWFVQLIAKSKTFICTQTDSINLQFNSYNFVWTLSRLRRHALHINQTFTLF